MSAQEPVAEAAQRLGAIDAAVILGSGLAGAAARMDERERLAFGELPGMPAAHVQGHPGYVALGVWSARRVAVFAGRIHGYEGYAQREVTFPVRASARAGARTLIVSNAAGGLNADYRTGDLMLITDHLNLTGSSPLLGPAREGEARFPDMVDAYAPRLRAAALAAAQRLGIQTLREGVYCGVLGPAYETHAEARFFRRAGADAVGMSTVAEVIAARALGLEVAGISVISNVWGDSAGSLTHEQVLARSAASAPVLGELIAAILAAG